MAKKIITKKQEIIILLIYLFRFINRKQLQEFLGHSDHRRINSWLKDLMEKGYIERDFTVIYGTLTKPAVYFLTAQGRKHMKSSHTYHFPRYLQKLARDKNTSKAFRIKCQLIADWYLLLSTKLDRQSKHTTSGIALVEQLLHALTTEITEEHIPENLLQFFTPAHFPSFSILEHIKPDAYMRKSTEDGIDHGLCFVIDAYTAKLPLQYLVKRIFTTLHDEYWETDDTNSLQLFFLCPNNQVIIYLKRIMQKFLENYYGNASLMIHLVTRNAFYKTKDGIFPKIPWQIISSED